MDMDMLQMVLQIGVAGAVAVLLTRYMIKSHSDTQERLEKSYDDLAQSNQSLLASNADLGKRIGDLEREYRGEISGTLQAATASQTAASETTRACADAVRQLIHCIDERLRGVALCPHQMPPLPDDSGTPMPHAWRTPLPAGPHSGDTTVTLRRTKENQS
jgi:hypothetical protein